MESLTRFSMRHRRWVFGFWLLIVLAGGAAAGQVQERLTFDFSLPGQQGYETEVQLTKSYGTAAFPAYIPTLTAPAGKTIDDSVAGVTQFADALRKVPGLQVVDYASTKDPKLLTNDGRTTFMLVYAPQVSGFGDPLQETVDKVFAEAGKSSGLEISQTGYAQLSAGAGGDDSGPSILVETLFGAGGALIVLVFVFASFLALVPLLIAMVAILATFLVVLGLTTFTDISFIVQFLISLVGLGIGIDYSLLVVTRWREERAHGRSNEDAVVAAMNTAGHAAFASGVTVAISLIALVLVPAPFLRSMGYGGMLIPVMSVLVVLTLLPALLSGIGPKVDWPRIRQENTASKGWSAWAALVVKHRWLSAGVAILALGAMLVPAASLQIGQARSTSLTSGGPAFDTMQKLKDGGVGTGILTTLTVAVRGGDPQAIADAAKTVPGIRTAIVTAPGQDGLVAVQVVPDVETSDSRSVEIVDKLQAAIEDKPGYVGIAGVGPGVKDYINAVYKNFPLILALISLVTFVLLVRTFRSLLLPLKAVLLNIVSIGAVFGVSTWFWQQGNGSEAIFDVAATGAMTFWIPILIFAFLFGLSMDYEVFILARMREEYDATGSTSQAVIEGLGRTGRLVTSAALILFLSFTALAATPNTDVRVFATALGVGILLDATIVRSLMVPSMVSLFGKYNWWLPASVAKVLRVEPSPLKDEVARPAVTAAPAPVG